MTRLEELQQKLRTRKDQPGFKSNIAALEEEIARLKEQGE